MEGWMCPSEGGWPFKAPGHPLAENTATPGPEMRAFGGRTPQVKAEPTHRERDEGAWAPPMCRLHLQVPKGTGLHTEHPGGTGSTAASVGTGQSQLKTYHVPPGHQAPQHLAPGKTRTAHRAAAAAAPCGAPGVWSWGVGGAQGPGGSSPPLWSAWLGPGPAQHSLWLTPAAPHSRSLRAAAADCVVPFHPGLHRRCEYRSMLFAGTSALSPVSPACPRCPRAPFFYGTYLRGAAG